LHNDPQEQFSIILQPILPNGQHRTLGHSFNTNIQPKMNVLKNWLKPLIDNFEAQSGTGEGTFTDTTLAVIRNVSMLPEPQATPITSSPSNVDYIAATKKEQTRAADRARKATKSPTLQAMHIMTESIQQSNTQLIQAMQQHTNILLEAVKAQPIQTPFNWTPLIQAVATAIPAVVGVPVTPNTSAQPTQTVAVPASTSTDPAPEFTKLSKGLETLSQTVTLLAQTVTQQSKALDNLAQVQATQGKTLETLSQVLAQLASKKDSGSNGSGGSTSSSNGSSSTSGSLTPAPTAPTSLTDSDPSLSPPVSSTNGLPKNQSLDLPVISPLPPSRLVEDFRNQIVTADFEAIISQDGYNQVYMAAWCNFNKQVIFDVTRWGNNSSTMLEQFWIDLITNNKGRICYFHNWAGYDSILSMKAL